MKCIGIIWNCAMQYENEILALIKDNSKIIYTSILQLGNSYENFVREIYSQDSIDEWKINEKIRNMKLSTSLTDVRFIIYDIEVEELFFNTYKKRFVYSKSELLKLIIRIAIMNKLQNYFFDITFHATDSLEEYEKTLNIINSYLKTH